MGAAAPPRQYLVAGHAGHPVSAVALQAVVTYVPAAHMEQGCAITGVLPSPEKLYTVPTSAVVSRRL